MMSTCGNSDTILAYARAFLSASPPLHTLDDRDMLYLR